MDVSIFLMTIAVLFLNGLVYELRRRVRAVEERNDALEDQIVYLETCLFRGAVVPEKRHQDGACQATEGRQS